MTQAANANAIGRRIRTIRGDRTQAEFAKIVGVSRAALANYETGRTIPSDFVILKMANAVGVAPSVISGGTVGDWTFEELAVMVGAKQNAEGSNDLSEDEKAIVRILRGCDNETAVTVAEAILAAFKEGRFEKSLFNTLTLTDDLSSLTAIGQRKRQFHKGITIDILDAMLARMGEIQNKKDSSETE